MPSELRERDAAGEGEPAPQAAGTATGEGVLRADRATRAAGEGARVGRMTRAAWRTALSVLFAVVAAPVAIVVGMRFDGGAAYATSTAVVLCALVPFLASFERRRPQAREIVLVAVLCAIAVASRVAFFWLPFFKPVIGVVMVAGLAFGAPSGFLVGALAALASDFFFGQGPWTPWQMLAYGAAGLAFGLLSDVGAFPRARLSGARRVAAAATAFAVTVAVTGPILDTSGLFLVATAVTPESAAAVYFAGLPVNAAAAACSALAMLFVANPLLAKLDRVRVKYGMLE